MQICIIECAEHEFDVRITIWNEFKMEKGFWPFSVPCAPSCHTRTGRAPRIRASCRNAWYVKLKPFSWTSPLREIIRIRPQFEYEMNHFCAQKCNRNRKCFEILVFPEGPAECQSLRRVLRTIEHYWKFMIRMQFHIEKDTHGAPVRARPHHAWKVVSA